MPLGRSPWVCSRPRLRYGQQGAPGRQSQNVASVADEGCRPPVSITWPNRASRLARSTMVRKSRGGADGKMTFEEHFEPGLLSLRIKRRIPTGFVHKQDAAKLQLQDDEDEDDASVSVRFDESEPLDGPLRPSRSKKRVPTGIVRKEDLPEVDGEDGAVSFQDTTGEHPEARRSRAERRVPTGFLHKADMPPPEDEESVRFNSECDSQEAKRRSERRVPTSFTYGDDELLAEDAVHFSQQAAPALPQAKRKAPRKPTGFTYKEDVPPDDDFSLRFSEPAMNRDRNSQHSKASSMIRVPTGKALPVDMDQEDSEQSDESRSSSSGSGSFLVASAEPAGALEPREKKPSQRPSMMRVPTGHEPAIDINAVPSEGSSN
mmetsp:Transcript_116387/g.213782  ORF Transcript_116387/g.213782 Transcript_116387/m.213782 type:complete len:375 (+) Transcript_116387:3-1127(+)